MKFLKLFLSLCLTFTCFGCIKKESDAMKFKKEYESLNGTIREKDKQTIRLYQLMKTIQWFILPVRILLIELKITKLLLFILDFLIVHGVVLPLKLLLKVQKKTI